MRTYAGSKVTARWRSSASRETVHHSLICAYTRRANKAQQPTIAPKRAIAAERQRRWAGVVQVLSKMETLMRKRSFLGLATLATACFLIAWMPQDAAGRMPIKYGDRLQSLVGEAFSLTPSGDAVQYAEGDFTLVAIGIDYAEFKSSRDRFLVPLSTLRVTLRVE